MSYPNFGVTKKIGGERSICFDSEDWDENQLFINNQELLFQKLYEWHFWTGDQSLFKEDFLIEKKAK